MHLWQNSSSRRDISIPLLRSGWDYRINLQKMHFYLNMMGTQIP